MNYEILKLMAEYLEKQDLLSKLTEKDLLHNYSYSEIHFIDAVGKIENANVTKIANYLQITRGAVSRMAQKQINQNLVEKYTVKSNRKEIYFRLTSKGRELFDEHEKRHKLWQQRDSEFFDKYSREEIEKICLFFKEYNDYLGSQIKLLS